MAPPATSPVTPNGRSAILASDRAYAVANRPPMPNSRLTTRGPPRRSRSATVHLHVAGAGVDLEHDGARGVVDLVDLVQVDVAPVAALVEAAHGAHVGRARDVHVGIGRHDHP